MVNYFLVAMEQGDISDIYISWILLVLMSYYWYIYIDMIGISDISDIYIYI